MISKKIIAQGQTDENIAQQLGRSTNAIRNIRHRKNIKTKEMKSIQELKHQNWELSHNKVQLMRQIDLLKKTHHIEDDEFRNRLKTELVRLKHRKPELFTITGQEQLNQLTAELGISIIRWLLSD